MVIKYCDGNKMKPNIIANLRHAARNCETVTIGGGQFGPDELRQAADILENAFLETQLGGQHEVL